MFRYKSIQDTDFLFFDRKNDEDKNGIEGYTKG
jgi:hypothetical protein